MCRTNPMQLCNTFCIQIHPTQMSIIMETFIPICCCWTNSAAALCIHSRPPCIELLTLQDQSLGQIFLKSRLYMCNDAGLLSTAELKTFIPEQEQPWLQVSEYQPDLLLEEQPQHCHHFSQVAGWLSKQMELLVREKFVQIEKWMSS